MDQQELPQQLLIEHQAMQHVTDALRVTIGWNFQGSDFSRKLSSVRFIAQSFQRHLKRLIALEEESGYMAAVLESQPQSAHEIDALKQEHHEFTRSTQRILSRLQRVAPTSQTTFDKICRDLLGLLEKLDEHSRKETNLLQSALLQDEGGEG